VLYAEVDAQCDKLAEVVARASDGHLSSSARQRGARRLPLSVAAQCY